MADDGFDKVAYWKSRMQDKLHSVDNAITPLQNEVLQMASRLDLELTDLVDGFHDIRTAMIKVAKAIENGKKRIPEPSTANLKVDPEERKEIRKKLQAEVAKHDNQTNQ